MKPRLVIVNVYFAPSSFGGATIVAEQMAWRLRDSWDILVVTTGRDSRLPPLHCSRYRVKGIEVIAVNIHPGASRVGQYMNPDFACLFGSLLASFKPSAVHFHCIQGMGAEMLEACMLAQVPMAVTVHDNWWLCERQFMINGSGEYCFQERIDQQVCKQCLRDLENDGGAYGKSEHRFVYLRHRLGQAAKVLFPSRFQRDFYVDNMPEARTRDFIVNKNGIQPPRPAFRKSTAETIRFGFVGGVTGSIKGFDLVREVFANLDPEQYELVIVDNTLNLGYSSLDGTRLPDGLNIRVVPAYSQENMDDFFSGIDVLLFPSQWKESFGLTVREALVRDVWVICTDGGGTVEDIVDGENGTIIPLHGSFRFLEQAVKELLTRSFVGYVNPYKDEIVSFDDQAEELNNILLGM